MRVKNHPILEFSEQEVINFEFEDQSMTGVTGDSIASALVDNGIKTFGYSIKKKRNRGFYCAVGNCGSCNMEVDGQVNVRTCITPLKEGMKIKRQHDLGVLK